MAIHKGIVTYVSGHNARVRLFEACDSPQSPCGCCDAANSCQPKGVIGKEITVATKNIKLQVGQHIDVEEYTLMGNNFYALYLPIIIILLCLAICTISEENQNNVATATVVILLAYIVLRLILKRKPRYRLA